MATKNFNAAGVRDNGDSNWSPTSLPIDGEIVKPFTVGDDVPVPEVAWLFRQKDVAGTFKKVIPAGSKFLITHVSGYKTAGAGGAGDTCDIQNSGTTLLGTGPQTLNVADKAALAFGTQGIDDAQNILDGDAGATLDLVIVDGNAGATDLSCDVIVRAIRLA